MKHILNLSPWLLSTLMGVLLSISWPPLPFFPLLWIAFIPLFILFKSGIEQRKSSLWIFARTYYGFLIWNISTTWWVAYASIGGAIAMLITNTLLMALTASLSYGVMKTGNKPGYLTFIIFWLGFEFLHFNWDIAYPWLTLGHGFAAFPALIQWYEYTGVSGGSLWVLVVNFLLFRALDRETDRINLKWILSILIPVGISLLIFYTLPDVKNNPKVKALVLQPNVDPYHEKFRMNPVGLVQQMRSETEDHLSLDVDVVIWPETAVPRSFDLDNWSREYKLNPIFGLLEQYPHLSLISGLETHAFFEVASDNRGKCTPPTPTARTTNDDPCVFYDAYNTCGFFRHQQPPAFYHKAKLVPGVEKMPYPKILGFLESLSIDLEGTSGSLGSTKEPMIFEVKDRIFTGVLICYESVFGNFVRGFVQKGAGFLTIITNDGWWKNTPGHQQHLYYGALRAIECRRQIARSANTGISCFIDHRGVIHQPTPFWEKACLVSDVYVLDKQTFFVKNGDLIGIAAACITPFLWLSAWVKSRITPRKYR
jgi:apolipoprotein N-acyltransferase